MFRKKWLTTDARTIEKQYLQECVLGRNYWFLQVDNISLEVVVRDYSVKSQMLELSLL